MNLAELFANPGLGVISTSSSDGRVNSAVYARPHVIDETTLVWGMTDKRTYQNLTRNRHAAFLFKTNQPGFNGVRLALELIRTEEKGELLATIKENAEEIVGPGAGASVTHAAWFKVVEVRSLI
ncbi:MAG: pyridoxamine 5'-phosphate oxidase family protein [Trichlorobacter sp.]|uniref:pyridoxamine 5'-phosphate oxidase family protein n=1 Tax=Trichlorobacter sp. TaxID=2911007 RepID=UPI002563BE7B|nr:pyridoxamine 5'-phosphate oxidase family protein [Trichlorobacter sp.]MDK9716858.1 pyridoxamine 5'-phosphate oxidase family protein [Trichlorobacter sp.]